MFMSCHIIPLVTNSLGGEHTHTQTHTQTHTHTHRHTHTDIHTETILRNQVWADLWPACLVYKFLLELALPF